jgi:hypothetical protein
VRDNMTRSLFVIALFAAAAISWAEAEVTRSAAATRERLLTLQAVDGEAAPGGLAGLIARTTGSFEDEQRRQPVVASYWTARYEAARRAASVGAADADPEVLLISANAAFRSAEQQGLQGQSAALALESVLQAYVTALKNGPFNSETAYNYEYVARVRDGLAKQKPAGRGTGPTPPAKDAAAAGRVMKTIHGAPGAHPAAPRGQEFEVITPMEFGEREAQPEPTPGVKPARKG